jgi:hypothetical protein
MPASKITGYDVWNFNTFNEYWSIEDDSKRQFSLIKYFIHCGALQETEKNNRITPDMMKIITANPVLANPNELGAARTHRKMKFPVLRQCVTGEALYVYGVSKDQININLVTHSVDQKKEKERCKTIKVLIGNETTKMAFTYKPTPQVKYKINEQTKKRRKCNQEPSYPRNFVNGICMVKPLLLEFMERI